MADLQELLSNIPMDQLASRLGVDTATAQSATSEALPALLAGLHANAQDPAGASSLESALGAHDPNLVEGGIDLDQVDTADGEKIVRNIFGPQQDQVVNQLGSLGGGQNGSSMITKLLPMLAPIVMAYLAKKSMGGGQQSAGQAFPGQGAQSQGAQGQGGGIGDLLGGLLGGGGGGGGGLGGLGGLLGGGGGGGGGGLGGLLGGLLGGGKR